MARIVIADDDPLIVEAVRAALEEHGHIVGGLDDGRAVVSVVQFKKPDLLILDISMPTPGTNALRELRNLADGYDTPVLMLTGARGLTDEEIARRAGADDYLRKPFDPDELVFRVEELLKKRRAANG